MRGEVKRPDVAARNRRVVGLPGRGRGAGLAAGRAERIARYKSLRARGVPPDEAAQQVGIDPGNRTAALYEREYQEARLGR